LTRDKLISFLSGAFLLVFIGFAFGVTFANSKPSLYLQMRDAMISWRATGGLHRKYSWIKVSSDTPRDLVTVHRPEAVEPGYRAVLGYAHENRGYAVWLFDQHGSSLHAWPIDVDGVFAKRIDDSSKSRDDDVEPHGLIVLRDGSIVLSFDRGEVLTRLDSCGRVIWTKSAAYHHMMDLTDDGNILVWRGQSTPYGDHQFIDLIDPSDGGAIRTISLEEILAVSAETHVINFSMPPRYEFRNFETTPPRGHDHFHPNDVEILSADMADAFPDFVAGDLLLSFKTRDVVAVIDGESAEIKWSQNGPWHQQHDPDFQPDGTITVFNNNPHPKLRRSSIVAVDPHTRRAWRKFTEEGLVFSSGWGGVHQALPNGTWQLVIPVEGRLIEVETGGSVVWEFNNVMTEKLNAYILNGTWLPPEYFTSIPSCQN
jgi:hypothetical protein